jgi:hypothetical protein
MPSRPRALLAYAPALAALFACGGHATSGSLIQGNPLDATSLADGTSDGAPLDVPSDGAAPECSACGDANAMDVTDAMEAEAADGGTPDQDADASLAYDDLCHVLWPQPPNVYVRAIDMAVASTGDAYLAISYDGATFETPPPALGLGDAGSLSHPVGVAIVKVDSACNPIWVREIGAPVDTSLQNTAIAVDAQSGVTVMGAFVGTVDFSGATLSNVDAGLFPGPSSPYLMRFDASGQVVFRQVIQPTPGYKELSAGSLAVAPDGTATVAVWEGSVDLAGDALSETAAQYFVQFDATGTMVSQSPASTTGPWVGPGDDMLADPEGGVWAMGGTGDGVISPYSASMVFHLTAAGTVTWTQPIAPASSNPLFAAGAGNAYLFDFTGGGYGTDPVQDTLRPFTSSGTSPWNQISTAPSYARALYAEQMVIDANGNAIVGGEFFGTNVTLADGSTTTDPAPSGIGFQAFDATGHLRHLQTWNGAAPGGNGYGAIAVDPQGNVLLAGTEGPGQEATTLFLAKLTQ